MKLIIAGSRGLVSTFIIDSAIELLNILPREIEEVVSGRARGIDVCGEDWAEGNDIPCSLFPADWDKYGKSAGYIRNKEMAEYGDELLAIWDGESKGTRNMIDIMKRLDKPVHIMKVEILKED